MQEIPGGVIVPASLRVKEICKRLDALELAVKNLTTHNNRSEEICHWTAKEKKLEFPWEYSTDCGTVVSFMGTPDYAYCPYCGKLLTVR